MTKSFKHQAQRYYITRECKLHALSSSLLIKNIVAGQITTYTYL